MANTKILQFSFNELCQATDLSSQVLIEIIEQGIVDPPGDTPENWLFDTRMILVTKRALRLHQDLDIDWSGIALAIKLLDELEQLRGENQRLQQRLDRFLDH